MQALRLSYNRAMQEGVSAPASGPTAEDEQYQIDRLQGVSRTFALTIPQLPAPLARVVSNAYLLCRIADTIEDDPELGADAQREFAERFIDVVAGCGDPEQFAAQLHSLLSPRMHDEERDLIRNTSRVIRITHSFNPVQRAALVRCIRIMANGMSWYQERESLKGLPDLRAMDRYCYYVAGVVGEMLTELFCDYSPEIAKERETLMPLAVSFGQALQMTNILKDIWEDRSRGACWLPRDIFACGGVDLEHMRPGHMPEGFSAGLGELIGVAREHLENALAYTLIIPTYEKGIRRFCLWALGMAVLTLKKINSRRDFASGDEVKISRRSVKATIFATSVAVSNDRALKWLFIHTSRDLPRVGVHETLPRPKWRTGSRLSSR